MQFDKPFEWSEEKNQKLIEERGISFEAIVTAIEEERVLDVVPHPRLSHQRIVVVEIDGIIVMAPFVEDHEKYFFKTAYHSRKASRQYKKGESK